MMDTTIPDMWPFLTSPLWPYLLLHLLWTRQFNQMDNLWHTVSPFHQLHTFHKIVNSSWTANFPFFLWLNSSFLDFILQFLFYCLCEAYQIFPHVYVEFLCALRELVVTHHHPGIYNTSPCIVIACVLLNILRQYQIEFEQHPLYLVCFRIYSP